MSKIYSNSKLSLYEQCPEAYKVKYIDKNFPEIPKSINLVFGSAIHEALEQLYKSKAEQSMDDLINNFVESWQKNSLNMRRSQDEKNFINKGISILINYYKKHFPFKENTIEIEKRIIFPLEEYKIQGYVDRIVLNQFGEYEIHDYKTNASLKTQTQIDDDRQLAFYHLGLQKIFGENIKVKLIWHFLTHNKILTSIRTEKQLEKLKQETISLIKKIESTEYWPSCGKYWCDWCSFKEKIKSENNGNHKIDILLK